MEAFNSTKFFTLLIYKDYDVDVYHIPIRPDQNFVWWSTKKFPEIKDLKITASIIIYL